MQDHAASARGEGGVTPWRNQVQLFDPLIHRMLKDRPATANKVDQAPNSTASGRCRHEGPGCCDPRPAGTRRRCALLPMMSTVFGPFRSCWSGAGRRRSTPEYRAGAKGSATQLLGVVGPVSLLRAGRANDRTAFWLTRPTRRRAPSVAGCASVAFERPPQSDDQKAYRCRRGSGGGGPAFDKEDRQRNMADAASTASTVRPVRGPSRASVLHRLGTAKSRETCGVRRRPPRRRTLSPRRAERCLRLSDLSAALRLPAGPASVPGCPRVQCLQGAPGAVAPGAGMPDAGV
jgi:hypothetical protein